MGHELTRDAYLTSVTDSTDDLAAAITEAPTALITACAPWTGADLAHHVGVVQRFWTKVLVDRAQEQPQLDVPRPPDAELGSWLRSGAAALVDAARGVDPTTSIWTWAPRRDAGFVPRRVAQETAMHRWDAEAAAGTPAPIESGLAVDGIDEVVDLLMPSGATRYAGPPIHAHLHCTDVDGEWAVHVEGGTLTVEHAHSKEPVAIRGSASDLLLLLWRRIPLDAVEVFGDDEMAVALVGLTRTE